MTSYKQALDGAEAVKVQENDYQIDVIVVWHGGTTFNVYHESTLGAGEDLVEVDVFNVSDDKGRSVAREEALEHMKGYLQRND